MTPKKPDVLLTTDNDALGGTQALAQVPKDPLPLAKRLDQRVPPAKPLMTKRVHHIIHADPNPQR